jgi:hypothetical protein
MKLEFISIRYDTSDLTKFLMTIAGALKTFFYFRFRTSYEINTMSTDELRQIRNVFQGLQTLYQAHLSKVDPALIHDLLVRELNRTSKNMSSSPPPPFYLVEIKTVEGTDQEKMKNMIFEKTGFLPSIHDKGTRYVANMRLSLELLKEICESQEDVVMISGDYTGGITGR